jgi:porin
VLDVDLLQTLQGVASGGRDDVATYWGTAEYTLNVDTQKLGLWPGGFLRVQGLSSFGQNINHASGALISPNFISLLPEPGNSTTGLMNLTFMQFLSPHFGVFLGKVSGLGADDNPFAHDYHTTFLNSGLGLNVALSLFPLTAYGGGLVILPWEGATFTVSVLDPHGTATDNNIGDAFQDGVLVAVEGRVTIRPFGLVGHQLLGGGWSNKERASLQQDPSNLARLLATNQFPAWPILARSSRGSWSASSRSCSSRPSRSTGWATRGASTITLTSTSGVPRARLTEGLACSSGSAPPMA